MITNIVFHTGAVEFDLNMNDRTYHIHVADLESEGAIKQVNHDPIVEYTFERLHSMSMCLIAGINEDNDSQIVGMPPSETLDQIMARQYEGLNPAFCEAGYTFDSTLVPF